MNGNTKGSNGISHKNNGHIIDDIGDNKIRKVNISWRSLNVTVPHSILTKCKMNREIEKRILKNADGLVKSGEMLALMGNLMIIL